jgi:nucleotide-binding universal stress UspA family protein
MTTPATPPPPAGSRVRRAAQVIIVGSVMFSFISYWRTAAVVLCDLGSTAYYIGGIVEQAIGPAAPWFILGVMFFSYAVRWVYIESCTLFIRGGVYRVVREALGGFFAKIAVSALLFDYLLTGPISGVSAGQYLVGLAIDSLAILHPALHSGLGLGDAATAKAVKDWGSVLIASAVVLYFYRQNLLGLHESSDKAMKIMVATTVVAIVMLAWCGVTLASRWDSVHVPPVAPDLGKKFETDEAGNRVPKINRITKQQEDPLGFLGETALAGKLRDPRQVNWLSLIGLIGIVIAFFAVRRAAHPRRRAQVLVAGAAQAALEVTPAGLRLTKPFRKLVAIRSPQNLFMLEKALVETDPETTAVIVMTAKVEPVGGPAPGPVDLDTYDQQLMTAVVQRAERAGKQVKPLIVPTNNPLYAIIRTARDLQAQELVIGASNKYSAEEQLDQIALYWINLHNGEAAPLTVRILGRGRDVHLDLGGGNRIPKISERKARSVAELRAAGVGVNRVLLLHDGGPEGSDLFQAVLTMLHPDVSLAVVHLQPNGAPAANGNGTLACDEERARQMGRDVEIHRLTDDPGPGVVRLARAREFDLVILPASADGTGDDPAAALAEVSRYVLRNAPCRVFLAALPVIPQDPEQT